MIRERLLAESPSDPDRRYDLASSWVGIAHVQRTTGDNESARSLLEKARKELEPLVNEHPDNLPYQAGLTGTLNDLGLTLNRLNRLQDALAVFNAAIERQTPVFARAPHAARYRHLISVHYFNKARYALLPLGEPAQAADAARQARRLNPEDPHNLWRVARVLAMASVATASEPSALSAAERRRCQDDAIDALSDAITFGLEGESWLGNGELMPLAGRPEFRELIDKAKARGRLAKK
jgi:tetratricopeptide (TPR) repeat protein